MNIKNIAFLSVLCSLMTAGAAQSMAAMPIRSADLFSMQEVSASHMIAAAEEHTGTAEKAEEHKDASKKCAADKKGEHKCASKKCAADKKGEHKCASKKCAADKKGEHKCAAKAEKHEAETEKH